MTPVQIQILLAQGRVQEAIAETVKALHRGEGSDRQWVELLEEDLLGPLAELHRTGKWKVRRQLPFAFLDLSLRKAELEKKGMSAEKAKDQLAKDLGVNRRYVDDALALQRRIEATDLEGLDLTIDRNAWWPQPPRARKRKTPLSRA